MAVNITRAKLSDIVDLYPRLRTVDYDEVRAANGPMVAYTLVRGFELSDECWAARSEKGELLAVWGTVPSSEGGVIWLLGTDELDRHRGALLRLAMKYVANMLLTYGRLYNYVDARNAKAIRWLDRLGFTIYPAEPRGYENLPFHLFEKLSV
jgi:ribosomal protein S18 acetylase RimI-like enzyme